MVVDNMTLAVTNKLTHRHMRCDNHCSRCRETDESVTHVIFECQSTLQE